ncbi:hypothetical protein [Parasphingorhabdus pacifica]
MVSTSPRLRGGRLGMVAKRRGRLKRCINRFEQWRGIATRYERTAAIYLAALHIAGIFLWSAR